MDTDSIVLIVSLGAAILVPMALLCALSWWVFHKGRIGKFLVVAAWIGLAYLLITAIWPLEGFYRSEFEGRTGLQVPPSARFIYKHSTFPDFHGDHIVEAMFVVSTNDFQRLTKLLHDRPEAKSRKPFIAGWQQMDDINGSPLQFLDWEYISVEGDDHFSWGLLSDGITIVYSFIQT